MAFNCRKIAKTSAVSGSNSMDVRKTKNCSQKIGFKLDLKSFGNSLAIQQSLASEGQSAESPFFWSTVGAVSVTTRKRVEATSRTSVVPRSAHGRAGEGPPKLAKEPCKCLTPSSARPNAYWSRQESCYIHVSQY